MPTLGAPSRAERSGGAGNISVSLTVTGAGNSVIVMTASIDTAQMAPNAVTGIAGVTFEKIAEAPDIGQTSFLSYRGSPTIWKADDVPAGAYTLVAEYSSSADLFACIVAQECTPCIAAQSGSTSGTGAAGALPSMTAAAGSLVLGMLHANPNEPNSGFTPPAGWTRQDVRQDGQSATSFDSAFLVTAAETALAGGWAWSSDCQWALAVVELADRFRCRALVCNTSGMLAEMVDGDSVQAPGNADHGAFDGLDGDSHTQYLNAARGDARYSQGTHTHLVGSLTAFGAEPGDVCVWNGSAWAPAHVGLLVGLTRRATAPQSSTATALAAATELSMFLEADGVYLVEAIVSFQTAATGTGINLGLSTPSGCRNLVEISVPINSGAVASHRRTTFPNASTASNAGNVLGTGVTAANSPHSARISGVLVNGSTAGALQVRFATEVSGSAVTVLADSEITLTRIA